jgi:hypothetical protein
MLGESSDFKMLPAPCFRSAPIYSNSGIRLPCSLFGCDRLDDKRNLIPVLAGWNKLFAHISSNSSSAAKLDNEQAKGLIFNGLTHVACHSFNNRQVSW